MIEKLSKIWSASIAYVMLLVGGGLSVAGNIADVYRTRGQHVDGLDIILAGSWPVLVILTIEGFVSRRWSPRVGFQVLRWVGCLGVGYTAMQSSWVHLHDLMATRGQIAPVAIGGPLAIDGMAIMATGLLLSTRGALATVATPPTLATTEDVDSEWMDDVATEHRERSSRPGDRTMDEERILAEWASDLDEADFASLATQPERPVSAPPALARSNEVKPESVPATARDLFTAWRLADVSARPTQADMCALVGAEHGVSARTARRWLAATKEMI